MPWYRKLYDTASNFTSEVAKQINEATATIEKEGTHTVEASTGKQTDGEKAKNRALNEIAPLRTPDGSKASLAVKELEKRGADSILIAKKNGSIIYEKKNSDGSYTKYIKTPGILDRLNNIFK